MGSGQKSMSQSIHFFTLFLILTCFSNNEARRNPLKSIVKDLRAIKGISKNVKAIRKDVRDIWEELLYIEGIVNGGLVLSENGTNITQEHSYNHETKEAVLEVPAHNDYGDNSYIMVGKDSDHPLAGKMMSVVGDHCELHDKPEGVDSDDLVSKRGLSRMTRNKKIEIKYLVKNNPIEIKTGSEEYKNLTEMMKQKCQGKVIMQVDMEVLDEKKYKEHLRNLDYSDSGSIEFKPLHEVLDLEKIVRSHKTGCPYNDTMAACQKLKETEADSGCWYWEWDDITFHHYFDESEWKHKEICAKCCNKTGTAVIPCDCLVESMVAFSTAYKEIFGVCLEESHFCNYDPLSTRIRDDLGCDYSGIGMCSSKTTYIGGSVYQDATCWKCYSNSDDCKSPCNCNPDDEDCGCTDCSIEGANCYIDTRDF